MVLNHKVCAKMSCKVNMKKLVTDNQLFTFQVNLYVMTAALWYCMYHHQTFPLQPAFFSWNEWGRAEVKLLLLPHPLPPAQPDSPLPKSRMGPEEAGEEGKKGEEVTSANMETSLKNLRKDVEIQHSTPALSLT